MGVKDLWAIIQPTGVVEPVTNLSGKVVAIDLSCWICDSQQAKMGGSVVRPHLRCVSLIFVNFVTLGLAFVSILLLLNNATFLCFKGHRRLLLKTKVNNPLDD